MHSAEDVCVMQYNTVNYHLLPSTDFAKQKGFPAQSMWKMFGALGIKGKSRKTAVHSLAKETERASSWLWLRRNEMAWKPTQTSSN